MIADMVALRLAGKTLVNQLSLHGQLAQIEWAEEKNRLLKMFIIALVGFACLLCFMLFAGFLGLMLSWASVYRIPVIILMITIYGFGVFVSWHKFKKLSVQGDQAFLATRDEIASDLAIFRRAL